MPAQSVEPDPLRGVAEGVSIRLRVIPGARRTELAGVAAGALRLRVAAPPVEGKANQAVLGFLAARLGVRPRDLRLTTGERGRDKTVVVSGLRLAAVAAALGVDDAAGGSRPAPPPRGSGGDRGSGIR